MTSTLPTDATLAELAEKVNWLSGLLTQSRWADPITRGGFPQTEVRDALPGVANAQFAYRIVTVRGDGATTPDVTYQCLRAATGAWMWAVMATGTP